MNKCSRSVNRIGLIKRRIDSIVLDMASSIESKWVTESYVLQCLGEENIPPSVTVLCNSVSEEVLMLN